MLTAAQIITGLQGTNAAARFFGVKPPSVSEWVKNGAIPEDKLIRKAAKLEGCLAGFSRRAQFPHDYAEIWPELDGAKPLELVDRREKSVPIDFPDRRRDAALGR